MASQTNPYGKYLGGQDPLPIIGKTPESLSALFAKIGTERQEQSYAPGKWSAREVICHLADCEIAFGFRLRQTLAQPNHMIQPFDQELWAKRYSTLDWAAALATFSALRAWNLALLRSLSPSDYSIPTTHPERGSMTFRTIVETMAGHDLNHLGQLETIASNASKS